MNSFHAIVMAMFMTAWFGFYTETAATADTWYKGKTHTVAWDAVTTYEDGTPIQGETPSYDYYIKAVNTGIEAKIGNTAGLTASITLPGRGSYRFGVQAVLGEDKSIVCWSDNPDCISSGGSFGGRWLFPFNPRNFRIISDSKSSNLVK